MNDILSKKEPEKKLLKFIKQNAGRSSSGRITVRHRGRGVKRLYRSVDFGQEKIGVLGKVSAIEYDPNRTGFLALVEYQDRDKRYVLCPQGLKVGDDIICTDKSEVKPGNRLQIKNIPSGTIVFNIEVIPGQGGKLIRSAGSGATVLAQDGKETHLVMPSGETRKVSGDCFVTVGSVSHSQHVFEDLGKAGVKRRKGIRPTVRGAAMNAVDHPHGGGEGKTPIGLKYPKTPWGKPAKGVKTRKRHWTNKYIIK